LLKLAFLPIKNTLDNDRAKYEEVCEKRKEAGKKGGRPHKTEVLADCEEENQMVFEKNKKTKRFLEKAKKPDNDSVNVSVNDNDNDNVSVNVCVVNSDEDNTNTHDNKNKLYGRFVKLTEEQHRVLLDEYGSNTLGEYIDRVDSYIENSGKKPYNNHYRTLKTWLEKDGVKKKSAHSYDLDLLISHAINNTLYFGRSLRRRIGAAGYADRLEFMLTLSCMASRSGCFIPSFLYNERDVPLIKNGTASATASGAGFMV
jgi:hypothetical protein